MNEQRAKKRYKVGKQPMWRSKKKNKKRKEVQKEVDPDKIAFLQYLGHLTDDEDQAATKK